MSRKFDSPVQTEMTLALFKNPFATGECHGSSMSDGKQTGIRRVFVQTEKGCVLGMELHRTDNAHTVKRRLHVALNFPIEESSLTFGDMVLKNDLSAIRNDSPLLLSRNFLHRSASTPCLSPRGRDIQQKDQSGPIEVLGHSNQFAKIKQLVKEIVKAMKNDVAPLPVQSGLGGAYYFRNIRGECIAIIKPTDEEPFAPNNPKGFVGKALGQPGLKRSVRVGETGYREVAAYLLDYDHFANVPPTALVKITHRIFNVNDGMNGIVPQNKNPPSKIASFQQFIPHDFDASEHGTSSFPVSAVHRIGILDVRILNTDRHAGNLLVRRLDGAGKFGHAELIPIDHGLCLPEDLEDPYFEWIHWPQASVPFSDDELNYIRNLDPARDVQVLRSELPMIRDACLRVLFLCTTFLKEAASYGLCLADIGEMMSREFRKEVEEPSELEFLCMEAKRIVAQEMQSFMPVADVDLFQFDIDCEDAAADFNVNPAPQDFSGLPLHFESGSVTSRNPIFKLEESTEEEEAESTDAKGLSSASVQAEIPTISMKSNCLHESTHKQPQPSGTRLLSVHRSANEPLARSVSFVKLADMSEEDWGLFLDKFVELLGPVLAGRKAAILGQKQRQRLGTSCKF